jgi:dolichol-phosphate mannosyltransferase
LTFENLWQILQGEGYPVRIVVRKNERGLSSAVLRGMREGAGSRLVCMDGDLQHPPEKVPQLLKALASNDFVIGTRYGDGFDVDKSWPWYRVVISKGARLLARPLTPLSDPMSGFFGISRNALDRGLGQGQVSALGFKIGLELYVKCGCTKHAEVNIFFAKREHGESKLSGKVMLYYILHLVNLYSFRYPAALPTLGIAFLLLNPNP